MYSILTLCLISIICFHQLNRFHISRMFAAMLVTLVGIMFHTFPTNNVCYAVDQIVLWSCGIFILSFNTRPLVIAFVALSILLFFTGEEPWTDWDHSTRVHLPICIALGLQ
jgi:hypothetical protein